MKFTNRKDSGHIALNAGVVVDLPESFIDIRGSIQPLVDGDFKSAQFITSTAGSVRANHYHKTDFHFMYLVEGEYDYYYRPAGDTDDPLCLRIRPGQLVYTPPLVEHAVRYVRDATFVNFSGNPRDQKSYENDLVRVELIKVD